MAPKIVLCTAWYPISVGTYLLRAMERMGHKVITVGPSSGEVQPWPGCEGLRFPAPRVDVPLQPGPVISTATMGRLQEFVKDADLWVDIDGGYRAPISTKRTLFPRIYINTDPHVSGFGLAPDSPRLAEYAMSYQMQLYPGRGGWLPYAADSEWFSPAVAPVTPDLEVAVPGAPYPDREDLAVELERAFGGCGFPVRGTYGKEHAAELKRAKVIVAWPLSTDLPMRVFEALAVGRPVVTRESASLERLQVQGLLPSDAVRSCNLRRDVLRCVRDQLRAYWPYPTVTRLPSLLPAGNFWEDRARQIIERRQFPWG